jgi:hypothetical protein
MKRFIIIGLILILATNNLEGTRIITNFDIARWYLDSDLVLVCNAYKIDTLFLNHHNKYTPDSFLLTYDVVREIYHIDIDSVIKPLNNQYVLVDSICSQDFLINYSGSKHGEEYYTYNINALGDTAHVDTFKVLHICSNEYSDYSYFRIENNKKHLVILSLTEHGYKIDYTTEISDWIVTLISEVRDKGRFR